MSFLKDVPTLRGDNYTEWRKKVDLAFVYDEVDWVVALQCRSNQQSQSEIQKMMILLGTKRRGIMLQWRWHIPSKTK
uniref:Uncharacterized protein n=1 Tax=Aegilops tauschii subsp. strangulata TaxID=200361 RepID=A0A453MU40_AEGTS